MAEIPFVAENVSKCLCPSCPVETRSSCVRGQMPGLKQALKSNPLKREEVPGLYCASGVAHCQDLDFKKACICAACPVYAQFKLKGLVPNLYYCRDGAPGPA